MKHPVTAYSSTQDIALEQKVFNSSPGELIILLYDKLIYHLRQGNVGIKFSQIEVQHHHLNQAISILDTLLDSLFESEETQSIVNQLTIQYTFWQQQILYARLTGNQEILDKTIGYATSLRDAWKLVVEDSICQTNTKD